MKAEPNIKKRVKRRLNIKRVFLLVVIIFIFGFIIKSALAIKVANIEIIGNEVVSDSKIIKLASLNTQTSYLKATSRGICKKIKTNPLINTCKVKKRLWLKFKIEITENKPLFFYSNTNELVLSNGARINEKNVYNVPTLINYVPEKVLNKFISGLSSIKSDIIHSISEIEYTPSSNSDGSYIDEERFMLQMNDGNIVYINNRNIEVFSNYEKIYASLGDRKGYYNFDADYGNYYFEDFENKK